MKQGPTTNRHKAADASLIQISRSLQKPLADFLAFERFFYHSHIRAIRQQMPPHYKSVQVCKSRWQTFWLLRDFTITVIFVPFDTNILV
jgi:hypothetical protein